MRTPMKVSRRARNYATQGEEDKRYYGAEAWAAGYRAAMRDVRKAYAYSIEPFVVDARLNFEKFLSDYQRLK